MDIFDLVYQVRMDLENARLSDHQVQFYKDQVKKKFQDHVKCTTETDLGSTHASSIHTTDSGVSSSNGSQEPECNLKSSGKQKREILENEVEMLREENLKMRSDFRKKEKHFERIVLNISNEIKVELKKFEEQSGKQNGNFGAFGRAAFSSKNKMLSLDWVPTDNNNNDNSDPLVPLLDELNTTLHQLKSMNCIVRDQLASTFHDQILSAQHSDQQKEMSLQISAMNSQMKCVEEENRRLKAELFSVLRELKQIDLHDLPQKILSQNSTVRPLSSHNSQFNGRTSIENSQQSDLSCGQKLSTAKGQVQTSKEKEGSEHLRILQLELQLQRAEYRAKIAEDCSEKTKIELNSRLVELGNLQKQLSDRTNELFQTQLIAKQRTTPVRNFSKKI